MTEKTERAHQTLFTDVLIVGAGPVGMTLALTLRRAGVQTLLVDKEANTGTTTRAAIVWPRTLEVFDLLGIVGGWVEQGVPIQAAHLTIGENAAELHFGQIDSPFPVPRGIGQNVTEALLDAAVKTGGIDYRRGVAVTALTQDADGVQATVTNGGGQETRVQAKWVVGCDGSRSVVRESFGINRPEMRNAGIQIIQGDFRVRSSLTMVPNHGYFFIGADHTNLLIIPENIDGHCRVLVTLPDDGATETPTLEQIQEHGRRLLPDLTLSDTNWLSRFRTQQAIVDQYRNGRAFLAGDAAHVWVPIGGQGMNVGIQDAFNLGWKLAAVVQNALPERVLDTYESERRPIGEQEIALTGFVYKNVIETSEVKHELLSRVIPSLLHLEPVTRKIAENFSEVAIRYAPNALVVNDHFGAGPSAGMRAPDEYVSRLPEGETVRLFDLYRPGHWVALGWVFELEDFAKIMDALTASEGLPGAACYLIDATREGIVADGAPEGVALLRDKTRSVCRAYHASHAGVHLIRPDGVIAYRGGPDAAPLRAFLAGLTG